MSASVKVMLSYDYCHFEVSKSTDDSVTDAQINEMRKDVQRLADEAVRQYTLAKRLADRSSSQEKAMFLRKIDAISRKPENEWSIEEKAIMKHYQDEEWEKQFRPYDYDDDDQPEFR